MADLTSGTQTNTQTLALDPQSLQALMADLQHLQANVLPKLQGIHGQILDYLGGQTPLAQSELAAPTRTAAGLGREAVGGVAAQRGFSPRTTSALNDYLEAGTPALLSPLAQAAQGIAGGTNTLVDPRLAAFLHPNTITSTSTNPSALDTATSLLKGAGSLANWYNQS